jgi:DNA mismatch repair protein MutS
VLVSLLHFAEEHLPSAIQNLHDHVIWTPETSVYMGNNTLAQLNYVTTGSEQSVLSLFQKCITSLGKRKLREVLLSPSSDKSTIEARLAKVEFFYKSDAEFLKRVESLLRMTHDLARLHRKLSMYTVTAADILALDQSYGCIAMLDEILQDTVFDWGIAVRVAFESYKQQFESSFDIEKAKLALKQESLSCLPSSKAPKTAAAEEKLKGIQESSLTLLEALRVWAGLPPEALRLETQDTFLFTGTKTTLGIVKKKLAATPVDQHPYPHISVHEKKSVRGTVECPELEKFQYASFHAKHQLQQAIKEELPVACNAVESPVWSTLENWISLLDVSLTLAKVAKERGYTKPELVESDESGVYALGLRHPLLESIQTRVEYVKHDVSLGFDSEYGWLLYGMNASGKSSLMKSIGVSVLLAQAGSFVPASVLKLKPFKSILTRILNQDSLWAGLSSFAVEVSELRDIFQKADKCSLVLGDELCSGTESISATSLVAAGIQHLHRKQARFVFATHLHDLNKLDQISSLPHIGIWHLRVHYDAATDRLIYDRTLHRGPGGTLYGLEVARAMHLPHEILKEAYAFRRSLLGEESLEEASPSAWNSLVIRKECEICHSQLVRDLEVHHIKPRAAAHEGKFEDGSSMNDLRNLIVVCQTCHDKHHAGELTIGPQKQTSAGPLRVTHMTTPTPKKIKVKWSEEESNTIEKYLRTYPHLSISRLVYDLKQKEDISISESALRKIKHTLS